MQRRPAIFVGRLTSLHSDSYAGNMLQVSYCRLTDYIGFSRKEM